MNIFEDFIHKYSRLPTENDPDYLEMLHMSKYRIMDVPDFKPGKCSNCGSSKNDGRKYVDFGLQVDWHGTVYLCGTCVRDIANNMGAFDEMKKELDTVVSRGAEIEEMHRKGEKLHELVVKTYSEFEEFYGTLHSVREPALEHDPNSNPSMGDEETAGKPRTNPPKPRTSQSNSSGGLKILPNLTDILPD